MNQKAHFTNALLSTFSFNKNSIIIGRLVDYLALDRHPNVADTMMTQLSCHGGNSLGIALVEFLLSVKRIFHRIWIMLGKLLVKLVPGFHGVSIRCTQLQLQESNNITCGGHGRKKITQYLAVSHVRCLEEMNLNYGECVVPSCIEQYLSVKKTEISK